GLVDPAGDAAAMGAQTGRPGARDVVDVGVGAGPKVVALVPRPPPALVPLAAHASSLFRPAARSLRACAAPVLAAAATWSRSTDRTSAMTALPASAGRVAGR